MSRNYQFSLISLEIIYFDIVSLMLREKMILWSLLLRASLAAIFLAIRLL